MPCRFSFSSRALIVASAALAVLLPLSPARAQAKAPAATAQPGMLDSAQQAAMFAISRRMQSPAATAIMMKQELGLSPEQVAAIEALALVEADSMRTRMARMMERTRDAAAKNTGAAMKGFGWAEPIDEAAIRAATCEQSRAQADIVIGLMRDRHALGALLTTNQQHQFDELQSQMMMRMMGPHK